MIKTLRELVVHQRLEVGPVRLERQRLITPYRMIGDGVDETTELIYRFEEDVFDPADLNSQNLAAMMAAQVALNYGLFFEEIVFHGVFDANDRRFLRQFAENTAREIYVKKFLSENPFLVDVQLEAQKLESYCQARLRFGKPKRNQTLPWVDWDLDRNRYTVLSSGGKDSLLSFGLLRELGFEVHPLFVNESGRHWFTAVNTYRFMEAHVPHTGRVWCNSDRVFTWFLRHLPFIRKDFADVRADIYPIRLWSVAVFLFGVLPLMRTRKISRLVIGDEYDTSVRATTHGIRHYDGLYDQSRWFDAALTRYFMTKGWAVRQFSILRNCSELLIENVLATRYPDLLEHQTSCHATHKDGDRMIPCGRCEKCRRIVGMLLAVGSDPGICGYQPNVVAACLKSLLEQGVHQEAEGARHLMHLLVEREVFSADQVPSAWRQAHPEVMSLRFDPDKSPCKDLPEDVRGPLFRLLLEHANQALRRVNGKWVPFDVLNDALLTEPYPFEHVTPQDPSVTGNYLWSELTWVEAEERLKTMDLAILPVGAIEQHGPHLPLDVDAYDADYLAKRVAEACSDPKPLVLPVIAYGVSYHHDDFAGTLSVSHEALAQMVVDIGQSLARNGIRKLVIINGHGGNAPALEFAAQKINRDTKMFVCVDTGETSDVDVFDMVETPNDVHAGEFETSTALATRPHLVHKDLIKRQVPVLSNRYLDFSSKHGVTWFAYTQHISSNGVMGDPTKATAEKGQRMWEIMIAHLVSMVEDLKALSLEEIYQKRY